MSKLTVKVNGKKITGWSEVSVTKTLSALAAPFTFSQAPEIKDGLVVNPIPIFPGDKINLILEDEDFLTGWVDGTPISIDGSSHSFGVKGRELTCDLVDCGIPKGPYQWKDIGLKQLITQLIQPFGLTIESAPADLGEDFKKFSAEPGDAVFDTIKKATSQRGVLPVTTLSGNIALIQVGKSKTSDRLIEGVNIKTASAEFDNSGRFSEYTVRGQAGTTKSFFGGESANKTIQVEAKSTDSDVERYRPKLIVAGNQMDQTTAQDRANWEATTRAANAGKITVVVVGWTQSTGELWEPGYLVGLESPSLLGNTKKDFLINTVKYTYGNSGTLAELSLVRPDAFEKMPQTKKKVTPKQDPWASVRKAVRGS